MKTLDAVLEGAGVNVDSHYFDASGQAVMRDRNQYLFADAGPMILFHWHGGKMGFHYWGNGEPFIVDSGECNYDRPNREKWYCTPPAHNSLLIDDDGDYDRANLKMNGKMSADCRIIGWESSTKFDSLTMIHNGFAKRAGMVWMRSINLIKDGFVLIVDQVLGNDAHKISFPFHFSPGKVEMPDASTCKWAGNACIGNLICADAGAFDDRQITSGLVSRGSQDIPASVITFSAKRSSVVASFMLVTHGKEDTPKFSVQQNVSNDQIIIEAHRDDLKAVLKLPRFTLEMADRKPAAIDLTIEVDGHGQ